MNREEEEVQKKIEQGIRPAHSEDEDSNAAYQHVFRALKGEPSYALPSGFADQVISLVEAKNSKSNFMDHLWLVAGLIAMITGFVVTIMMTDFTINLAIQWGFLQGLSSYKGMLFFGILFIALLHFIDRQFIRPSLPNSGIKKAIPFL